MLYLHSLEVAGDPFDFIPIFNRLDKKDALYRKVCEVIDELKNDNIVGVRIKRDQIPRYYVKKHDINAAYKVDLPGYWRLIFGIITIHDEMKALLMELFDHAQYNKRFGYK